MARPTEQTVLYFKHDTHTDKKTLFVIQKKWGDSGYTFWFKLLELLGRTDGHFIDCREPETWEFLVAQTQLEEVSVTEILDKLARMNAIDKELWQNGIIWSQNFVDRLKGVYAKRAIETPSKPSFCKQKPRRAEFPSTETPQPRARTKPNLTKPNLTKGSEAKGASGSMFDYRMAVWLRKHVESYKGIKQKTKAELKKWVDTFRLMRERDGLEPYDIRRWLLWAIADEFWRGNILSAGKFRLRVQEGKIQAAMERVARRSGVGGESPEAIKDRDRIAAARSKAKMKKIDEEAEAAEREANVLAELRDTDPVKWAECILTEQDTSEEGLRKTLGSRFVFGLFREAAEILLRERIRQKGVDGGHEP